VRSGAYFTAKVKAITVFSMSKCADGMLSSMKFSRTACSAAVLAGSLRHRRSVRKQSGKT
jgi:hypothetical protein